MEKMKKDWTYGDYKAAGMCPVCKRKDSKPAEGRAFCDKCRQQRLQPHKKAAQRILVNRYKASNRAQGLCDRCKRPALHGLTQCQVCSDMYKEKRQRIRNTILEYYGNKCVCCGETQKEFLTIDHVNNDAPHEKKNGCLSGGFYSSIIKRGFPATYQILCWNCNCAKGKYGRCPHPNGDKI